MKEITYQLLPNHIKAAAKRYIEKGVLPGKFLQAVICNNLKESFETADQTNRHRMFDIVKFFYNEVPAQCWGSEKALENWCTVGGLDAVLAK